MNIPLVSVIIPTYKRSEFLCTTIDSVLAQTYPNIEIIVVDDNGLGTTFQQETETRLQSYIRKGQINYICHKVNKNGSAARNTGFRASHGEYINFLDDDDELFKNKIELQVNRLLGTDEHIGATYCNSKMIWVKGILNKKVEGCTKSTQEGNVVKDYLLGKCRFGTSSLLFKRNVIESLGGFDESYYRHQDVELITRFFSKFIILCTSLKPLFVYDISKDRKNVVSCESDYKIKDKFLSQFENYFGNNGIKNEVFHHFWFSCASNAIRMRNYKVYKKALQRINESGRLSIAECIILLKGFCVGLLSKR